MRSSHQTPRPVWVGMSDGVDSSLAVALLVEAGHECTGVTMDLGRSEADRASVAAAAAVCTHLGIEHRTIDLAGEFRAAVVDATAQAYARDLTPNPCVLCNVEIKFGALFRIAEAAGAMLATGHYVRIVGKGTHARLARATDAAKDQSYFLYRVTPDALASLVFPLGGLTKAEVRVLAAAALETSTLTAIDAVWSGGEEPVECEVKVRYNSPPVCARVTPVGRGLHIEFAAPIFGAAPGQSAVCYQGGTVIGGGFIGEAL